MNDEPLEFSIELRRDGEVLETVPASLAALSEDALFRGVVAGRFANDGGMPEFAVTPHWKCASGRAVSSLTLMHGDAPAGTYERSVFAPQAGALVAALVKAERIRRGDAIEWELVAVEPSASPIPRFSARASRARYPFHRRELAEGPAESLCVHIDAELLEGIRGRVVSAAAVECAGLLVGRLFHDPERKTAALEVTGRIDVAAGRGGASGAHFAFDPHSFNHARSRLQARGDGAIAAGWYHSHVPCAACPRHPRCSADTVFFSADDLEVHSSAFPDPYMVGLVAGKVATLPATRPGCRLYGWEQARIVERPYRVLRLAEANRI